MQDLTIDLQDDAGRASARVSDARGQILELAIHAHMFRPASHRYQARMSDASGDYLARIRMDAPYSEHEDRRGQIGLHPHAFNAHLDIGEVDPVPFREQWMRAGIQTFEPLIALG